MLVQPFSRQIQAPASALTNMAPNGLRMRHRRPNVCGEQRDPGAGGVLENGKGMDAGVLLTDRARLGYCARFPVHVSL